MFDESEIGNGRSFGFGASSEDKIRSSKTFFGDSDSVRVEKIGKTFEASDAGIFVDFFIVATGFDDGFELIGGQSRKVKMEILVLECGKSLNPGIRVRKIERDGVGEVVSV